MTKALKCGYLLRYKRKLLSLQHRIDELANLVRSSGGGPKVVKQATSLASLFIPVVFCFYLDDEGERQYIVFEKM